MKLEAEAFAALCRAREKLERPECRAPVEALAREARMSPFHFIRRFAALFGVTPHQLRVRSRLERAKRLLAAGRHSVTDVCMEVGFSSVGSFSALFAARVGEPPSAFRRRMHAAGGAPGIVPKELTPGCLTLMEHLPASVFRNFREAAAPRAVRDSVAPDHA
ncbi:MAG TPA: helix-turn-helix transcriptional regulator [Gammaproteobacteria bacterium]|nr:helix-turn-helix transcriptional regulator [Gammaproteobacteria bacterium]